MRESITISLPEEMREELDSMADSRRLNRSELIREALRSYIQVEKFRELRRELVPKAERQGIVTDQDVFDEVS